MSKNSEPDLLVSEPSKEADDAFQQWWAGKIAEGYHYGRGPTATVKFGFEAGFKAGHAATTPHDPPSPVSDSPAGLDDDDVYVDYERDPRTGEVFVVQKRADSPATTQSVENK